MTTEYRLQFTTLSPLDCQMKETSWGPKVWGTLSDAEWEDLPWKAPTVKTLVDKGNASPEHRNYLDIALLRDQHHNLLHWAMTHEQPIKDVSLERRTILDPNEGWEPAE